MILEFIGSNCVVVAHQFNPSIVGQLWLVWNELLEEADFRPGCVFTDMLVQVSSQHFNIMLVPDQCQFSPNVEPEREQQLILDKVGAIVRLLPHTPYQAIGLNFIWQLAPEDSDIPTISRELFFVADSPLHREFDGGGARFGTYMSKDWMGDRLRLAVKPITLQREGQEEERIQFAFNFHRDVKEEMDPVAGIEDMLGRWNEAREESSRLAHTVMRKEPV